MASRRWASSLALAAMVAASPLPVAAESLPVPPPRMRLSLGSDGKCAEPGGGLDGLWFRMDVADAILRELEIGKERAKELGLQERKVGELRGQLQVREEQASLDRATIKALENAAGQQEGAIARLEGDNQALKSGKWVPWAVVGGVVAVALATLVAAGQ